MNTSWDAAKFEVCAHKWTDFADGGYGAALIMTATDMTYMTEQ